MNRIRRVGTVVGWAPLLVLAASVASPPARPASAADANAPQQAAPPFAAMATAHVGNARRVGNIAVIPLRLPPGRQAGFAAHVGLRGASTDALPLPMPAGEMHVWIANRGDADLEIPPGDTLLSPLGPSRSADRTVWIPAGAAAFVPVIHAEGEPPPGPYLSRGVGLTPIEQERVRPGTWDERVVERNRRFGVDETRLADASAAYATEAFQVAAEPYRKGLQDLGPVAEVVGVLVADARGIFFGRLESDSGRFAAAWPSLLAGIALDGVMSGAVVPPVPDEALHAQAKALLGALRTGALLTRPNFGLGNEHRVALADGTGAWEGLAIDGKGVTLTLLRTVAPPPPPPTTPPENTEPRAPGVIERDPRPSPFEERWNERR